MTKPILTTKEKIIICMGEVYRFRTAVGDERKRVREARKKLRSAQEEANLLGRTARIIPPERSSTQKDRLKTHLQFVLVAAYDMYAMAKQLRKLATGTAKDSCVQQAVKDFESAAPHLKLLRHVHEHMNEYALGGGLDRPKFPQPDVEGTIQLIPNDVVFSFGGLSLSVEETVDAALQLSADLHDCEPAERAGRSRKE